MLNRTRLARFVTGLSPQPLRNFHRVDALGLPLSLFLAAAMKLAMVDTAQGHGEFIADLASERAWLPEPDVMRIGRTQAADKTWLRADEVFMRFIPLPKRLKEGDGTSTDFHRSA